MAVGYSVRSMRSLSWSAKAVIAAVVLAVLLVAAVPVTLLVGLVMVLFGHIVGGLALFGASILAAGAAIVIASLSGVRQLRKLVRQQGGGVRQQAYRVVQLRRGDYFEE
jgi:uncharacterized membrane protein YdjX (TVP38/TMEM64 family)